MFIFPRSLVCAGQSDIPKHQHSTQQSRLMRSVGDEANSFNNQSRHLGSRVSHRQRAQQTASPVASLDDWPGLQPTRERHPPKKMLAISVILLLHNVSDFRTGAQNWVAGKHMFFVLLALRLWDEDHTKTRFMCLRSESLTSESLSVFRHARRENAFRCVLYVKTVHRSVSEISI